MPSGRCSRAAYCAAARERSRPMARGTTSPGNRTRLRTGTMATASSGSGRTVPSIDWRDSAAEGSTRVVASALTGLALSIVCSFIERHSSRLAQLEHKTAIDELARFRAQRYVGQSDASLEKAVGNFQLPHFVCDAGQ